MENPPVNLPIDQATYGFASIQPRNRLERVSNSLRYSLLAARQRLRAEARRTAAKQNRQLPQARQQRRHSQTAARKPRSSGRSREI